MEGMSSPFLLPFCRYPSTTKKSMALAGHCIGFFCYSLPAVLSAVFLFGGPKTYCPTQLFFILILVHAFAYGWALVALLPTFAPPPQHK